MRHFLSFRLDDDFVHDYVDRDVPWGFACGGGLTLGELAFVSKYSRQLADAQRDDRDRMRVDLVGSKERWFETCRRVTEGTYSLLKDHCLRRRTPWNEQKAQRSAQEAYERMFTFKWLPPGRGLWMMGTEFVHGQQNSAALNNCAFVSTGSPRGLVSAAHRLMEMSMLGVGVGFDSLAANEGLVICEPDLDETGVTFTIEDSREGWCDSVGVLLESYLVPGSPRVVFDYSQIRSAGEPIRGFGGVAAGPAPLRELHESLRAQFDGRLGDEVTTIDVGDVMNKIGRCVVAGNVRRSAEIWLGGAHDKEFLNSKNGERYPERTAFDTGWGWASNNSVVATVGDHYDHLVEAIAHNGEPGLVYLDLCRDYGRLADAPTGKDYRVAGVNPCGEQPLEDGEMCTLVNSFPTRCDDLDDYLRTLKFAYLYGKAVTLFSTHWEDTNEVMRRNHRIGTSMGGQAQFVETYGYAELKKWQDLGYGEVRHWDTIYSEWLGVRESVKVTTVKPDGTTALLVGCTPGVHWPSQAGGYLRRMRFGVDEPIVQRLIDAGFHVEPDVTDPRRVVAELPTTGPSIRGEREVSVWEKAELAALAQRHWSDNAVSVTLTFRPDEASQIGAIIHAFDGRLKTASFLPLGPESSKGAYPQMPYEAIDLDDLVERQLAVRDVDREALYLSTDDAEGERYCTTDVCELVPVRT